MRSRPSGNFKSLGDEGVDFCDQHLGQHGAGAFTGNFGERIVDWPATQKARKSQPGGGRLSTRTEEGRAYVSGNQRRGGPNGARLKINRLKPVVRSWRIGGEKRLELPNEAVSGRCVFRGAEEIEGILGDANCGLV